MKFIAATILVGFTAFMSVIGVITCLALLGLCGCTYNVSMAHTEGTASDVIDDTQAPQNTVSPNIDIPALKA